MTAEGYRALLETDFSDVDIEQSTDIRTIKIINTFIRKETGSIFETGWKSLFIKKRKYGD